MTFGVLSWDGLAALLATTGAGEGAASFVAVTPDGGAGISNPSRAAVTQARR